MWKQEFLSNELLKGFGEGGGAAYVSSLTAASVPQADLFLASDVTGVLCWSLVTATFTELARGGEGNRPG